MVSHFKLFFFCVLLLFLATFIFLQVDVPSISTIFLCPLQFPAETLNLYQSVPIYWSIPVCSLVSLPASTYLSIYPYFSIYPSTPVYCRLSIHIIFPGSKKEVCLKQELNSFLISREHAITFIAMLHSSDNLFTLLPLICLSALRTRKHTAAHSWIFTNRQYLLRISEIIKDRW